MVTECPRELVRTLGKYTTPLYTDLVSGVYLYRNHHSNAMVIMLREGTEWSEHFRSDQAGDILIELRRLGVKVQETTY